MVKKRSTIIFIAIVAAIIIVLAAFIILTNGGSSTSALVGVRKGDEFIYDIKGYSSSGDSSAMSEEFLELNMTDWYKVTVTDVSGSDVSLDITWRYMNGTEISSTSSINVETGIYYPTNGFYPLYAANLKANDFIRPHGPDRSTINATSTRQYASGARETNRRSLVIESYDSQDPTRTWTENQNIQFDRQTGMLVELRDVNVYTNPEITLTVVWTLKETNRWTVS